MWSLEYAIYCEILHYVSSGSLAALAYWLMRRTIFRTPSDGLLTGVFCICLGVLLHVSELWYPLGY